MNMNCEYVREVYPDVLNNKAEASIATAVRAHIARCADCREEATLIEQLRGAVAQAPAGLQERITGALTRPVRTFRLRNIAYAATVAAAIIGGSVLLRPGKPQAPLPNAQELGFVTVEDAMVSGTSSLRDLTIEELEVLLGEIES